MSLTQEEHHASTMEDPTDLRIGDARRATFSSRWPHESKRGWVCKTEKMVDAGWYYAPTPESDDYVTCVYCKLSLDGWEPKDNPYDEHHRRSPECLFFSFATKGAKNTRGKKGRASKGARPSTQANPRLVSQAQSIPDFDDSIDTSTISLLSTTSALSNKKGRRGRKGTTTADDASANDESVAQPEQESVLPITNTQNTRGKKRTSEQISDDEHGRRESTVKPERPAKRRTTRVRNSVADDVGNASMVSQNDVNDNAAKPTKTGRINRKRGSSVSKRTSAVIEAAIRAGADATIPDDAAIEAALAAELDKPLSDEDELPKEPAAKPKRGRAKKTPASKPVAPKDEDVDATMTDAEAGSKSKRRKITRTSKLTNAQSTRSSIESVAAVDAQIKAQIDSSLLTVATFADDSGHETDASMAGKSVVRKGSKRKAPAKPRAKRTATRVTSRTAKPHEEAGNPNSVQSILESAAKPDPALSTELPGTAADIEEKIAELTKEINEEDAQAAIAVPFEDEKPKPKKSAKEKAPKPKGGKKKERVPQLSMPGAFSPLRLDSVEPSFASALETSTPPLRNSRLRSVEPAPMDHHISQHDEMEIRSPVPEQQSTPTPRRGGVPPPLPPRSSARPTPVPAGLASAARSPQVAVATPSKMSSQRKTTQHQESPKAELEQSSDAENAPPSSLPKDKRPPLQPISPTNKRLQALQPNTPQTSRKIGTLLVSPSKIAGVLKSDVPWTSVDVELCFQSQPQTSPGSPNKSGHGAWSWLQQTMSPSMSMPSNGELDSPEKKLSVEQWIRESAGQAEERLRLEGERVVHIFEQEGARALRTLEGIQCS